MTVRAIFIGLLFGLAIASFGYLNDWVFQQAYVASDLIPVSVYGPLVLGLLLINPLLRLAGRAQLKGAEWAVIVSLMLMACVIPGPGLMWNFSNSLVMPHHFRTITPGWRDHKLLEYAPPVMLIDPTDDYDKAVAGFKSGLQGGRVVPVSQVPWGAWTRTLSFWGPLVGLSFVAGICLVLVVHGQWAHRERLRYPVADFASELLRGAGGSSGLATIFRNGRFWIGLAPVLAIMLINGYQKWNTDSIQIPLQVDLTAFGQKWPSLAGVEHSYGVLRPTFYFAAVGFAYFVSSNVSFSLGISHLVYAGLFIVLTKSGMEMQTSYFGVGLRSSQLFGSYLGVALIIFYIGRRFYLNVLMAAFCMPHRERIARSTTWACRVALLSAAAMVLMLVFIVHLDWLLAVMFVMLTGLLFLVVTRISVETGLFFIQPSWHAVAVLLGLFGIAAMGPNMLIILALLCVVMTIDPRVCLMPLAATAMRLGESEGIRPRRIAPWMVLAVLLALVVGLFATVYVQYCFGGGDLYNWASSAAQFPFQMLEKNLAGFQGEPGRWYGLQLEHFKPNWDFVYAAGIGLALVWVCSVLRLRLHWWPIHPVLFLVWGTFPLANLAASFLLGWLIKVAITRLGGSQTYRRSKPLFIGMVAGEFLGGIIWAIVGLVYYLVMRVPGEMFRVHP